MKKIFILLALIVPFGCFAENYQTLLFQTADGGKIPVPTANLVISVDDGKLFISNTDESMILETSDLMSMEFIEEALSPSITESLYSDASPVKLYTLDGLFAGEFCCIDSARENLPGGIYIIKLADGGSLKVNFKK